MTRARLSIFVVLVCLLFPIAPEAQQAQPADEKNDNQPFKGLKYRAIGPAQGGRVSRVAGIAGNPSVYYAAIASIGSMAVAPSDHNIIYVGSGEANIRGNVAAGNGIYKSIDAGKTWKQVWKQEGQIGTMVVDPRNADVAYAAVLGHALGPNPELGVYRTQ